MSNWNLIRWFAVVGTLLLAIFIVIATSGCAESQAKLDQDVIIRDPETGQVVFSKSTGARQFQRAPNDAAGPTTQSVTAGGIFGSIAGVHTRTADQIVAENGKLFYYAAAGFALLAVVGFALLKSTPLAIGCGIAGGACALTPTFLDQVGPWLLPFGAVAAVSGLVWYAAKRHASNQSSRLGGARLVEADKLGQQGKYAEALDAMRSGIDVLSVNKPSFANAINGANAK